MDDTDTQLLPVDPSQNTDFYFSLAALAATTLKLIRENWRFTTLVIVLASIVPRLILYPVYFHFFGQFIDPAFANETAYTLEIFVDFI